MPGANLVPSGRGCEEFAETAVRSNSRMIIGEERAVERAVGRAGARCCRSAREPAGPARLHDHGAAASGETGLRRATLADLDRLLPACAAAHELELGLDPRRRDDEAFRWRVRNQIEEGRSWLWLEDGVILFKAEASAWTPSRGAGAAGVGRPRARGRGNASRGLRDLCRLLLETTPTVTLFVRTDNLPAIRLYESIGMQHVLSYRSILFP